MMSLVIGPGVLLDGLDDRGLIAFLRILPPLILGSFNSANTAPSAAIVCRHTAFLDVIGV
jgi:hypothetical protein